MKKDKNFKVRLGVFIVVGIMLFIGGIYYIGKNRNLFSDTFQLSAAFHNVAGLQIGNNVRFSGINIGTVDAIQIVNDTSVMVDFLLEQRVRPFIKKNANAIIGSEGLMGNKVINIIPGTIGFKHVEDKDTLATIKPLDIDDILKSVKATADNAQVLTGDLAYLTTNIRGGKGMVGKLFSDTVFAKNIDRTIVNLKKGSQGLSENMDAAKESFLLKPLFKKKKKKDEKDAETDKQDKQGKQDKQDKQDKKDEKNEQK
jgi:phospholipid/cholesterol/gamma-HCH transport system substrate-binding protein